jgi:hypothetical protein
MRLNLLLRLSLLTRVALSCCTLSYGPSEVAFISYIYFCQMLINAKIYPVFLNDFGHLA